MATRDDLLPALFAASGDITIDGGQPPDVDITFETLMEVLIEAQQNDHAAPGSRLRSQGIYRIGRRGGTMKKNT